LLANAPAFIISFNKGEIVGRKQDKALQRKSYQEAFKKVKHGHGGRPITKKEESALGK
jgi:hypothetical protein